MKSTINLFNNGAIVKLKNRRIHVVAEDEFYYIQFIRFDKELPGRNKDKIIKTPLYLSFEATNALIQALQLFTNKKLF